MSRRRATIMAFVDRASSALDQVDYYRLLSISSAANQEEVQTAYYKLAASLHPDVHGADVDPEEKRKLTKVFSRVAEAYRVLSNTKDRSRYDRELALGNMRLSMGADVDQTGPDIQDPSAMRFYKLAVASIESGDYKSAIMNLRFALQKEPESRSLLETLAKAEKKSK